MKGSFYNRAGRKAAIDEIVTRIESDRVNEPDAFATLPPRLGGAREIVKKLHPDVDPLLAEGRR